MPEGNSKEGRKSAHGEHRSRHPRWIGVGEKEGGLTGKEEERRVGRKQMCKTRVKYGNE